MATTGSRIPAWTVVVATGILAAMHVWKLPSALDFIRADLGIDLVAAGALVGVVQLAGGLGGLAASVVAERIGSKNTLLVGLVLAGLASVAGGFAVNTAWLMTARAIEGVGFILITVVAPAMVRVLAPQDKVNGAMGWWGAFQGIALFLGVGISAVLLNATDVSWNVWWFIMGAATLGFIPVVVTVVPADPPRVVQLRRIGRIIVTSIGTPLPWALGLIFASYTLQWGAILSFLPTIFGEANIDTAIDAAIIIGIATAIVGGVNGIANIITGMLLQRGHPPRRLLITGLTTMAIMSTLVFAPDWSQVPGTVVWAMIAAAIFSFMGALVPTTVTRQAVDIAPEGGSPSAVVGLITQMFNLANFVGPVILSAIAAAAGTWQMSWTMTVTASAIGIITTLIFVPRGVEPFKTDTKL
ncbi:MFS transporter [Enteractinococcus coprophilus]|uniref:Putative MFS family arabinose efflux permease n=1 Tax=Enteractinococcus coprophilus TaxID=1027633 RepID=A0A543AG33_9MICC|nr:MFS transporter [Enteractinococcus coprophilus]TQL71486.1 putative MFS family arabinose efflux permease [Enteractinococcus coprophilus]